MRRKLKTDVGKLSSGVATYVASSSKFHKYLSKIFKKGHENIIIIKKWKKIGKIKCI